MSARARERHADATSIAPTPKLQNASDIIHPWRVSWYSLMSCPEFICGSSTWRIAKSPTNVTINATDTRA